MRTVVPLLGLVLMFSACSGGGGEPSSTSTSAGSKIAFALLEKNESDPDPDVLSSSDTEIYIVSPDGSSLKRLTNNFDGDGSVSWSPEGARLAEITLNGRLFLLHANGGPAPARLAEKVESLPASWSPDGTRLTFGRGGKLWIVDSDGGGLVNVPVKGVDLFNPVWGPDGNTIAFMGFRGNPERGNQRGGVYVVNLKRGRATPVATSAFPNLSYPAWSPDGRKIAFQRNPPQPGLFVVNPDGSGLRRLTDGRWDLEAEWSPDGEKIAFIRYRHEFDGGGTLYLADVATGTLFAPAFDLRSSEPTWSPDGTEIAFIGPVPGKPTMGELYVMSIDGSPRRVITHTGGKASEPAWSPGS
jgi:Tol biopolymer transport system component